MGYQRIAMSQPERIRCYYKDNKDTDLLWSGHPVLGSLDSVNYVFEALTDAGIKLTQEQSASSLQTQPLLYD